MYILMNNKNLIQTLMIFLIDIINQFHSILEVMEMNKRNVKQNFIKIYLILKINDILLILKFYN